MEEYASFTPINRKVFSIFDFFSTQSTLLQFLTRIFLYILRFKLLIVSIFFSDQIQTQGNTYLDKYQKTGKVVRFLIMVSISLMFLFLAILVIAVILQVLSYFGIITLPSSP